MYILYDIFYIVFEYIDFKSYKNLIYTCKKFYEILKILDFYEEITNSTLTTHKDKRNGYKYGKTYIYSSNSHREYFLINDKIEHYNKYFNNDGSYIIELYKNSNMMYEFDCYQNVYIEQRYLFDGNHIHRRTFDLNCNILHEEYTIKDSEKSIEIFNCSNRYKTKNNDIISIMVVYDFIKNIKYEITFNNSNFQTENNKNEHRKIQKELYYKIELDLYGYTQTNL